MAYKNSKAQSTIGLTLAIGPIASVGTPPTGITGTTTSASTSVTALTSIVGVTPGLGVSGTGIAPGTTVVSATGSTLVLSIAATASGTAVALTFTIVYTPIFELSQAPVSGFKWDVEDTTNFNSLSTKEYLKTLLDSGKMALTGNRVSTDAGQVALKAAFLDAANAYLFQITYPLEIGQTTTGDVEAFAALVEQYDYTLDVGKVIKISTSLQRTGAVTFTEGA